jgi:hypothetical protein
MGGRAPAYGGVTAGTASNDRTVGTQRTPSIDAKADARERDFRSAGDPARADAASGGAHAGVQPAPSRARDDSSPRSDASTSSSNHATPQSSRTVIEDVVSTAANVIKVVGGSSSSPTVISDDRRPNVGNDQTGKVGTGDQIRVDANTDTKPATTAVKRWDGDAPVSTKTEHADVVTATERVDEAPKAIEAGRTTTADMAPTQTVRATARATKSANE